VGDAQRAEALYDLLLPYADRTIASGYILSFGSAETPLGMLAATLGRWNEAANHFETAFRRNSRMGNKPLVALTAREHAAMLIARDAPGDRAKARELLATALALIEACGLTGLRGRTDVLLTEAETAPVVARASTAHGNTFRREGDYWTISFAGDVIRVRDIKGIRYLAHLIKNPGVEIYVVDVAAAAGGATAPTASPGAAELRASGLRATRLDDADEVIDADAKASYKRRLIDLQAEMAEAREWGDAAREERAEAEIEALAAEIARAAGLGGRARTLPSPGERARVSVTKAIRTAIDKISESSPTLAAHLTKSVRTGRVCVYDPGLATPAWHL
jgi:hypothetical protein